MTIGRLVECVYNDRGNDPRCTLERETELNDKGQCPMFKTDYPYLTEQFRERHGFTSGHIEAQSYENLVLLHATKLRRIMRGGTASKVLTMSERDTLRREGIIQRNGRFLEVSPRAQAILEVNAHERAEEVG